MKKNADHGRVSALKAKSFLVSLGLSNKEVEDTCYAIAAHVDGESGYPYEDTIEAKIVTDADNIDRFSSSKIHHCKIWCIGEPIKTVEERIQSYSNKIKKLESYLMHDVLETKSGNETFKEKLHFNINFYRRLKEDLLITHEPIMVLDER